MGEWVLKQRPQVLFVTYNGLLEPIGQSQIVPYLKGLARQGFSLGVLSFEKVGENQEWVERWNSLRQELSGAGIRWIGLRYHRSKLLLIKIYDLLLGALAVFVLSIRWRIQIIHARSAVAGAIALPAIAILGKRLLFDVRGFNAEEYVDGSGWSRQSLRYRVLRAVEGFLIRQAHEIVVLTERARTLLYQGQYVVGINGASSIQVIPSCVDLTLFRYRAEAKTALRDQIERWPLFVYVGSLGTWYLLDEMLACFRWGYERWPSAHLLILTPSPGGIVEDTLDRLAIPRERVTIRSVPYAEVPMHLSLGDVGLCFIKPSLSKLSSSPTKIGEYLACGLPILANAGVGDVEELVRRQRVGVVLDEFSGHAYQKALDQMEKLLQDREGLRQRCRAAAEEKFSLLWSVRQYRSTYERMLGTP